ncbi:MAG: hypothetical protein OFPII_28930 [Osedax symbiont Rs1]|nr:MAG: hypothetical protein OFPII_28930 [Osedax symbiont Rs1]
MNSDKFAETNTVQTAAVIHESLIRSEAVAREAPAVGFSSL